MTQLNCRKLVIAALIMFLYMAIINRPLIGQESGDFEYLSDAFNERGVSYVIQNGQGELGWDTTYKPYWAGVPKPIRIVDKTYAKGLGVHGDSEVIFNLEGLYKTFTAEAGIAYQGGNYYGSAIARVIVDGKVCFESKVLNAVAPAVEVQVDLTGAKELKLVTDSYNKDHWNDDICWADARLFYNTEVFKGKHYLEVGTFAQVITCDPAMVDGPKLERVKAVSKDVLLMDKYLFADDGGNYEATAWENGKCSIGLRWYETRNVKKLAIEFADGSPMPDIKSAKVQWWVGDSPWQGQWRELDGNIKIEGRTWSFDLCDKDIQNARNHHREGHSARMGAEKIRWIFDKADHPIRVLSLNAWTHSLTNTADIVLKLDSTPKDKIAKVTMYNGTMVDRAGGKEIHYLDWDIDKPLAMTVRYKTNGFYLADKTSVRVEIDGKMTSIAVEDIMNKGPVYVGSEGLFASSSVCRVTPAEYTEEMAAKKALVERVQGMKDQTFQQAWEHVHRKVQDGSPMMVSLACSNSKFVVTHEGTVWKGYHLDEKDDGVSNVAPTFGLDGKDVGRTLYGGWLPIPVIAKTEKGIQYNQKTFVAPYEEESPQGSPWWYRKNSLCVSQITIENTTAASQEAVVVLKITSDLKTKTAAKLQQQDDYIVADKGGNAFVVADIGGLAFLKAEIEGGTLKIYGVLPGHAAETISFYMPSWDVKTGDYKTILSPQDLFGKTERYWKKLVAGAMQVDVPDTLLSNLILASQVHCYLAAREKESGNLISPWISADRYGALESESQAVIIGMDLVGQEEFARRSHDFFLKVYNSDGYLTTGYTLMGTGQHLMTLGKHYKLNQNEEWMKNVQPIMVKACEWITSQIDKNKYLYSNDQKPYDYGLFPPGVYADWNRYAYHCYMEAFFYGGLKETTDALQRAHDPSADVLLAKADQARSDFMRAYEWTQQRFPVIRQSNGNWWPGNPSMIGCFGLIGEIYRGEDSNRAWAKDGDKIFALVYTGLIDAEKNRNIVLTMANQVEEGVFLAEGMGQYTAKESQEDWFNIGGFGKCQPYYTRLCETYAQLDEIKPFLRTYFNPIGGLVDQEILTFWEHFLRSGGWNKTHETGWFLEQTRLMLLTERGNDLWIAPFVTTGWMEDGMTVGARQAPTDFGSVDYKITSHAKEGYLEAEVTPPTRNRPDSVVVRLRHPQEKKMKKVTVNGQEWTEFDAEKETVTIKTWNGKIVVRANY